MKLTKMFTQRTIVGCVQNMISYSKYRIFREDYLRIFHWSAITTQKNSYNHFHTSLAYKRKYFGTSRKTPFMADKEVLRLYKSMTVGELAKTFKKSKEYVIKRVLNAKIMEEKADLNENTVIDNEAFIRKETLLLGYKVEMANRKNKQEKKIITEEKEESEAVLVPRPPVVTIMGHVDHGKTTLLDTLRKSNIVDKEFGGITQHIGAFLVTLPSGETITFLDTPGHAAFSAMRARGAKLTDIVILVVAADDGVLPQTVESIEHARNANVPIIVALNKIDKKRIDKERVRVMLLEHGVVTEESGGNVQLVPISALKGTNVGALQEAVIAQAELMELRGNPTGNVKGRVVESEIDQFLGKTATVIVQKGTLRQGDFIVAGNAYAKVRKMLNEHGKEVYEAGLSIPVRVIGWKGQPSAGEEFEQVENERVAKSVSSFYDKEIAEKKDQAVNTQWEEINRKIRDYYLEERKQKFLLEDNYRKPTHQQHVNILGSQTIKSYEGPQLFLLLVCDVDGSLEAIMDVLDTYSSKMCKLTILKSKIGNITKSEVDIAAVSKGIIYGFNINLSKEMMQYANENNVEIKMHNVIYKLFDCLKTEINKKLPPVIEEDIEKGEAIVLKLFTIDEKGKTLFVIGCLCTSGRLFLEDHFKVLRGPTVLFKGTAKSLKVKKDDVEVVDTDSECGLVLDGFNQKLQEGDRIVCYSISQNSSQIDWELNFSLSN